MPRISRNIHSTHYFHIMTQGINKQFIFNDDVEIKYYIKLMYKLKNDYSIKIISYCIMNNHAHILLNVKTIGELSLYMQRLNLNYGKFYNKKHDRVGYVFRDRFKSEPIYDQKQLLNCVKYIYDNPVKAGICSNPASYPYSNYKEIPIEMFDNNLSFLDTEEDKEKEYLNEINNFVVYNHINNFSDDKILLSKLVSILKNKHGLSLRAISQLLNIGRETLRKVDKQIAVIDAKGVVNQNRPD